MRNYLNAGIFGVCVAGLFYLLGGVLYFNNICNNKQLKQTEVLVQRVMKKAVGEDRVLSSSEKRNLLDRLGIDEVIDENEVLVLTPVLGKVYVYATIGGHPGDNRNLGNVPPERLKEYLEEKVEVEKNE